MTTKQTEMSKQELLEILELLSAFESWSFSTGKPVPDYIWARLETVQTRLREEVLK